MPRLPLTPSHPSPRSARLPSWLLWACLSIAALIASRGIVACADEPRERAPLHVQPSWQTAKSAPGHVAHVTRAQIPCESCHAPNEGGREQGLNRPSPERCVPCHVEQSAITHDNASALAAFGAGSPSNCMACHGFIQPGTSVDAPERLHADRPQSGPAPSVTTTSAWECARCHGLGTTAAHGLQSHRFSDCSKCHTPHGPSVAKPSACNECHPSIELSHGAHANTSAEACTSCHTKMHASKQLASDRCGDCHLGSEPRVPAQAVFADGHTDCASCHRAHDFGATQAAACQSCHQNKHALGAARIPAHAACDNCHDPHDVKRTEHACNGCHSKLTNDHPAAPGATTCGSCHPAHPTGATPASTLAASGRHHASLSVPCSDCHEQSMHDGISHAAELTCTACHVPHHFDLTGRGSALCKSCHANQHLLSSVTPGHGECSACHGGDVHLSQHPAVPCASCHQANAQRTHPGHAECRSCHEPHSAARVATCRSCHEAQHRSAPLGHQDCTSCHDPHGPEGRITASCESCHQAQSKGLHAKTPGGCQDCHRAHGPGGQQSPPSCASCHPTAKLPALHSLRPHQNCATCHSGHSKQVGDARENCLSCHQAQRATHYPNAPSCSSCHLFQAL